MDKDNNLEYWEGHEDLKDSDSARFAVDWFGERLRNPSFNDDRTDWKASSTRNQAIELHSSVSKEELEAEIKSFQRTLYKYLCGSFTYFPQIMLLCDYQPIDILGTLSSKQKNLVFPPRTYMLITDKTVKVGSLSNITENVEPIFVAYKDKIKDKDK